MRLTIHKIILFLAFGILLSSCDEKFNVAAPYKDIIVVNGYLNIADTAHYIRIEKGFLDQNKSALDMAKVADSNYYNSLQVVMKVIDPTSQYVVNTITLHRVDLALEGYTKDTGTFFTNPNYAYKFTNAINASYNYRLVITHLNNGEVDSSLVHIVDTSGYVFPAYQLVNSTIQFYSSNVNGKYDLSGTGPTNAAYYEGVMRVYWIDSNISTLEGTLRYADWKFASAAPQSVGSIDLQVANNAFFLFVRDNMGNAPNNIQRYLEGVDIMVYGGSQEYYDYIGFAANIGTGITGMDVEPVYTNIISNKQNFAYGLLASRSVKVVPNLDFHAQTKAYMDTSSYIQNLFSGTGFTGKFAHRP
jgi:hypothetical protein